MVCSEYMQRPIANSRFVAAEDTVCPPRTSHTASCLNSSVYRARTILVMQNRRSYTISLGALFPGARSGAPCEGMRPLPIASVSDCDEPAIDVDTGHAPRFLLLHPTHSPLRRARRHPLRNHQILRGVRAFCMQAAIFAHRKATAACALVRRLQLHLRV